MFGKKDEKKPAVYRPENGGYIYQFCEEVRNAFIGSSRYRDVLSGTTVLEVSINDNLWLKTCLAYNFPLMPPQIYLKDADVSYQPGLEALLKIGMLNAQTGQIYYDQIFGYTPAIGAVQLHMSIAMLVQFATLLANQLQIRHLGTIEIDVPLLLPATSLNHSQEGGESYGW